MQNNIPLFLFSLLLCTLSLVHTMPTDTENKATRYKITDLNTRIIASINDKLANSKFSPANTEVATYALLVEKFKIKSPPFQPKFDSPNGLKVTEVELPHIVSPKSFDQIIAKVPEVLTEFIRLLSTYFYQFDTLLQVVDTLANSDKIIKDINKKLKDANEADVECTTAHKALLDSCENHPSLQAKATNYHQAVSDGKNAPKEAGYLGWRNFYFIRDWWGTQQYFEEKSQQTLTQLAAEMVMQSINPDIYSNYLLAKKNALEKYKIFQDSFKPVILISKEVLKQGDEQINNIDATTAEQLLTRAFKETPEKFKKAVVLKQIKDAFGTKFEWTPSQMDLKASFVAAIKKHIDEIVAQYISDVQKNVIPVLDNNNNVAAFMAASTSQTQPGDGMEKNESNSRKIVIIWIIAVSSTLVLIICVGYWYWDKKQAKSASDVEQN